MTMFSNNIESAHIETVAPQPTVPALPLCVACGERITFYMHQEYHKGDRMRFYHPECCPSCKSKREAEQ